MATPCLTRSGETGVVYYHARLAGGSSSITKTYGQDLVVTYIGTGVYRVTWAVDPGTFLGMSHTLGCSTPGNLKGYSLVRNTFVPVNGATAAYLEFTTFADGGAGAPAAADVIGEIDLTFAFRT